MQIREVIEKIANEGGETFLKARDKGHAESMRVTAFNYKRKMPEQFAGNVGIQVYYDTELCSHFLRIFDRKIDGAEMWVKDSESGKLIPAPESGMETARIVELMRQDGKTEEEIKQFLEE